MNDDRLTPREHSEMRDLVLAGTQHIRPAGSHRAQFIAAGVALLLVGAVTGGFLSATLRDDGAPEPISTTSSSVYGQVAFTSGLSYGQVYVVEPRSAPHRVTEDDIYEQVCPAFSSDGRRLAYGEATGDDQSGWRNAALVVTGLTPDGDLAAVEAIHLPELVRPPCPIWSPDGQWIAFGAETRDTAAVGSGGGVWIIHVDSASMRPIQVPATDIEWSADSTRLYLAGDMLRWYSIGQDRLHAVPGTTGAIALAASPDGETLAVETRRAATTDRYDLLLMRPDGSDQRNIEHDYTHADGIGPVWSPDGSRVVFQRTCTFVCADVSDPLQQDEIVVVTVADGDHAGPRGMHTVLPPTQTMVDGRTRQWIPTTVTWAPDSQTLRFIGWEVSAGERQPGLGLLTVPIGGSAGPAILWEAPNWPGPVSLDPPNDFQSWRVP